MSSAPAIATVSASEASRALATLTAAFIADPLFRWAYPDAEVYLDAFPKAVDAYYGSGIAAGTARAISDFAGAAIWLAPGAAVDDEAAGAVLEETMDADRLGDFFGVLEQMGT